MLNSSEKRPSGTVIALCLVFLSGFVALIYQVLWMKQLGLLFGSTSHATSVTLASFFAGLATGSWILGKRVSKSINPMRTYAWLEIGIATTALLYFAILWLFHLIFPSIYQNIGSGALLLLIKFALALLLIFPPAFCMGGTIPVMGQFMIQNRNAFGKTSALMYGINTFGAALGAGLAGFYLPAWLGFNLTCIVAIFISFGIAIVAYFISRQTLPQADQDFEPQITSPEISELSNASLSRQERRAMERQNKSEDKNVAEIYPETITSPSAGRKPITLLCFLSGFGILALEVLWTRMFSQVLENSVYTFATILVVVLISLALGAMASSLVARSKVSPLTMLSFLLIIGSISVASTPFIFVKITNGMELITSTGTWFDYILLVFKCAALSIGPTAVILGMIFPYLMKSEESHLQSPGVSLGRLATVNTIGAIFGAMFCGFFLLDWLGVWRCMQCIALLYIAIAIFLPLTWDSRSIGIKAISLAALLFIVKWSDTTSLPITSKDPHITNAPEEKLIEIWQGSDCTVSVTETLLADNSKSTAIKVNSSYGLGSSGTFLREKLQSDIPLMMYPETESIFYLGVGTGISAGSSLSPQHQHVKRIVACELIPEVITAAKKYMTNIQGFDITGGLFKDSRAQVLIEDGRHHLMATNEKFDMINADLFVPYHSGSGSLYSREHFEQSKNRLTPDGIFVQWLPLYQITENEFSIIANTMIGVFDQVSLWRHNFQPGSEIVALVGHQKGQIIPASHIDTLADRISAIDGKNYYDLMQLNLPLDPDSILLFYGGNLTAARQLFAKYPINTDDRPVIQYLAPRSNRIGKSEISPWFVGNKFADFVDKVQAICPPENDPLLANRSASNKNLPLAGSAFHRAFLSYTAEDETATKSAWEKFVKEWTTEE